MFLIGQKPKSCTSHYRESTLVVVLSDINSQRMTKPTSKDSDQPGHPPSLIRIFTVCMKKA